MNAELRVKLICLCILSLFASLVILAFTAGAKRVPWRPDSRGRLFSFNDSMSPEHYRMAFQNVTWERLKAEIGFPEAVSLLAPVIGVVLLSVIRGAPHPLLSGYFLVQVGVLPFGLIGIPVLLLVSFSGGVDGECLTDGPMMSWMAQGIWLTTAAAVGIVLVRIRRQQITLA